MVFSLIMEPTISSDAADFTTVTWRHIPEDGILKKAITF
jgi:hypothetical protein